MHGATQTQAVQRRVAHGRHDGTTQPAQAKPRDSPSSLNGLNALRFRASALPDIAPGWLRRGARRLIDSALLSESLGEWPSSLSSLARLRRRRRAFRPSPCDVYRPAVDWHGGSVAFAAAPRLQYRPPYRRGLSSSAAHRNRSGRSRFDGASSYCSIQRPLPRRTPWPSSFSLCNKCRDLSGARLDRQAIHPDDAELYVPFPSYHSGLGCLAESIRLDSQPWVAWLLCVCPSRPVLLE